MPRKKADRRLDDEQRKALEQLYYTEFRAGIGMRALWGLWAALRDHPRQKAALEAKQPGWIPWRTFKQWYNSQAVAQIMRRAPTVSQTRAGMPNELDALAQMQADVIDMGELEHNGYRYILNIVDLVTGYSVLQTWRGGLNNRQTSRVVKEFVDVVRDRSVGIDPGARAPP